MSKQSTPRSGKSGKAAAPAQAAAKPAARKKTRAAKRASDVRKNPKPKVDDEIRRAMVAQAAYFRAEKRGFMCGCELDDWYEAEREISRILDE